MSEERPGVRQIAKLAGVSTATVSRVYRGVGAVSPQMRRRVQAAIDKHGYRPNHLGEALARQRYGAIGIVFPGLSGPYFADLIDGVESVAVEHGLSVHVIGTHRRREAPEELLAMARRVDGMIVHGGTVSPTALSRIGALGPLVQLGAGPAAEADPDSRAGATPADHQTNTVAVVRSGDEAFTELVTHLLRDHGRRRLIFVGDPAGSPDITTRWRAFVAAHLEAGVEAPPEPIRVGLRQPDGVLAAEQVFAGSYDGAVCANDETAVGMLLAALGQGIAVPEELVITGVDDVALSAVVRPGLTTVARPLHDLGATTVRLLLDLVEDRPAPAETVLASQLIRRASCGCPPSS